MTQQALYTLTVHQAASMLRDREISATQLAESVLDRIYDLDNTIKAFLTLTPELALEAARQADERFATADREGTKANLSPLLGIPVAIKDVITVEGVPLTCGSRILEGYVPPYQSTVMSRLDAAGAVMLGKTNTDEFAMGSSTENSALLHDPQPWDLSRVPGGLEWRQRGGRRPQTGAGRARDGHRRQRAPAGEPVRRGRAQAHLRPRQPLRAGRLCVFARPDRSADARMWRTQRSCSARSPGTIRATARAWMRRCRTMPRATG